MTVFASWKSGKSSSEHFVDNLEATFVNFVNSDLIQVVCSLHYLYIHYVFIPGPWLAVRVLVWFVRISSPCFSRRKGY